MKPEIDVTINANCSSIDLISYLAEANAINCNDCNINMLIEKHVNFYPCALSFLASWCTKKREVDRCSFFFSGGNDTMNYLSRMNLFQQLHLNYDEHFNRHTESGRFLPLHHVSDDNDAHVAHNAICDLVLQNFDNSESFLPGLEWAVYEVLDNAVWHSQSTIGSFICAQYYPTRSTLTFAVCDAGIGIKQSFNSIIDFDDDYSAIKYALQKGTTSTDELNRGNGLAGLSDIVRLNQGHLDLWSGINKYHRYGVSGPSKAIIPSTMGTGVSVRMNTNIDVDLTETFIESNESTYLEWHARTIDHDGGMKISEISHDIGSREAGKRIGRKLVALLDEVYRPAVLDFDNVESVSNSYLMGLLVTLGKKYELSVLEEEVLFINTNLTVERRINAVLNQLLHNDP